MANLVVTFTAAVPAPSLGYYVEYREFGVGDYIKFPATGPNPTASPVLIPVVRGKRWEVKVKSQCAAAQFSTELYQIFDDRAVSCYQYKVTGNGVTGTATIGYINCSSIATSDVIANGERIFFCARNGSVTSTQPAATIVEEYDPTCLTSTHGFVTLTNNTGFSASTTFRNTTTNVVYGVTASGVSQIEMIPFGTYEIESYAHGCTTYLATPAIGGTFTISAGVPNTNIQINCT